ncbi:MAG: rhomboid family intramembrane serine protease [Planctomycetaceae bacterium]|nr:rhomboid family intramembrane serine protease [Planctomycetaceae bacterium]
MTNASRTVRQELHGILIFVGVLWAVFLVRLVFPQIDSLGIVPRTLTGLVGVVASPFLHANFQHLLSNTFPLLILLALLAGSQARSWEIVLDVALLGGLLLWLVGRNANHIGASGLIFGLIVFLIVSGFRERRPVPLMVAILVGFLYGGTLLWAILPLAGPGVSWDGHLCGAAAGATVAYMLTRSSAPEKPPLGDLPSQVQ